VQKLKQEYSAPPLIIEEELYSKSSVQKKIKATNRIMKKLLERQLLRCDEKS
jgi:hypothetical protein